MRFGAASAIILICLAGVQGGQTPIKNSDDLSDHHQAELRRKLAAGIEQYADSINELQYDLGSSRYVFGSPGAVSSLIIQNGKVSILDGTIQTEQTTIVRDGERGKSAPTMLFGGNVRAVFHPDYVAWKMDVGGPIGRMRIADSVETEDVARRYFDIYGSELHTSTFEFSIEPRKGRMPDGSTSLGSFVANYDPSGALGTMVLHESADEGSASSAITLSYQYPTGGGMEIEFTKTTTGYAKTRYLAIDPNGLERVQSQVLLEPVDLGRGRTMDLPVSLTTRIVRAPDGVIAHESWKSSEVIAHASNWRGGEISTSDQNWLPTAIEKGAHPIEDSMVSGGRIVFVADSETAPAVHPSQRMTSQFEEATK